MYIKMKHIKNLLPVLTLAALTACSSEDVLPGGALLPEGAVHITANIADARTRAVVDEGTGSGYFETGDRWGLYAGTADGVTGGQMEYRFRETVLYWKDLCEETVPVTFSAHFPYIEGDVADPTSYVFMCNNENRADNDLLFATDTRSQGETVDLTFHHLMHNLVVRLSAGEGVDAEALNNAVVSATAADGTPTLAAGVEVNLLTGDVNAGHVEGLVAPSSTGSTVNWIVAPQELTPGSAWLTFEVDGDVWRYNVPADLNWNEEGVQTCLESGRQLTLNLTLKKKIKKTEVVTQSAQISAWGDTGTIEAGVMPSGPVSGDIDMTGMTMEEVKNLIRRALVAGVTEFTLTGPASCLEWGYKDWNSRYNSPFCDSKVKKVDLSGVTDWQPVMLEEEGPVEDVVGLPAYTFFACYSLEEVILPAEVKAIGAGAFSFCHNIRVELDNITHFGWEALAYSGLQTVTAPEVVDIRSSAFRGNGSLESISFDKVPTVGDGAFEDCNNLATASLPSLKTFGTNVFAGCPLSELRLTAAGPFTDMNGNELSIFNIADWGFDTSSCNLILNADKQQDGAGSPTVTNANTWLGEPWQSITFE